MMVIVLEGDDSWCCEDGDLNMVMIWFFVLWRRR
jgi:hypothetical protein